MPKENLLPHKIDAFRFADNKIRLQGTLLIKNMERLSSSLIDPIGEVSTEVEFGVDEQGIRFMRGHFATHLTLQCQRCMETFRHDVSGTLLAGIVQTEEEADQLPPTYDSVMADEGGMLILQNVIEDEIIVSLPIVPMHDFKECKIKLPLAIDSGEVDESKESPFKVIEFLRSKRDSNK